MGTDDPLRRLSGRPNEIRAHLLARGALIDLVIRDPTFVATLGEFDEVFDLAHQLGALAEAIARQAGLSGRGQLFDAVNAGVSIPLSPAGLALQRQFGTLRDTYERHLQTAIPVLRQRLETLVYETWRREWLWLVGELLDYHQRLLSSLITGDGETGKFIVRPKTLPPPPAPAPGETVVAYLKRQRAFYATTTAASRDRTGVRVNAARIERDVRIFYRLELKQPPDTIRAVAKAEGKSRPNTKRARDRAINVLEKPVPRPLRNRGNSGPRSGQ